MPIVDMPLSFLRHYRGTNPRPKDVDAFWDASVHQMEKLGTGYELEEASFRAPGYSCYHLYFTGVGGARVHAKFVRPENAPRPMPAVCHFHGYTGASPEFGALLPYAACGLAVLALDCRGQGGLSQDNGVVTGNTYQGHIIRGLSDGDPAKLLFRQIFLDAAQLARIAMAMPDVDETRVGACGGSQGGGLTLACAALTPGLKRAAPQFPFLCDYKRVWEMDLAKDAYEELRTYFRRYDPLHERENEIFTLLGYIDNQHIAHRIRAEVRMFTGLMDTVCPPSTQFAAYNRMTCKKEMVIYPDYGHEDLPGCLDSTLEFLMGM